MVVDRRQLRTVFGARSSRKALSRALDVPALTTTLEAYMDLHAGFGDISPGSGQAFAGVEVAFDRVRPDP
jgi:hypothetical protein